ncbi:hypothetical protein [Streptomyces cyaneofuscatus]
MRFTINAAADLSGGRAAITSRPDKVRLDVQDSQSHALALFLPGEARKLAAALLRAADEADWSSGVNTFPEVPAGSLRTGDVLTPHTDYRGNDSEAGMVCESTTYVNGPYMTVVWRDTANGETLTSSLHEKEIVHLLRRGPEAGR